MPLIYDVHISKFKVWDKVPERRALELESNLILGDIGIIFQHNVQCLYDENELDPLAVLIQYQLLMDIQGYS